MANPLFKVAVGLLLLVLPLALYVFDFVNEGPVVRVPVGGKTLELTPLDSLWTVIQGTVPPLIALIGLFIVWLELDEWRIERELKAEEEKEKKKK